MNPATQNFSVGFQNIHGLHGPLGCKASDLERELKNDIEIWCEVWRCECGLQFEDYTFEIIDPQKDKCFHGEKIWRFHYIYKTSHGKNV